MINKQEWKMLLYMIHISRDGADILSQYHAYLGLF